MGKESQTVDGLSSMSTQCFLQLSLPQLQELADGYLMCKTLIKANLQRIHGSHIPNFHSHHGTFRGNLAPRVLLLKLGSHLEHYSHSEMSFEVKTHLFMIQESAYKALVTCQQQVR